ncbi:MAG: hypothetical protein KGH75_06485 [Rhodospirillales bacterium]|nr:hypothetical protein [Rhodospirillales bacterium]
MKSLLLDRTAWDLVLDSAGNIAVADEPYRIAQDVATACRTFAGECLYDTTLGVPYLGRILGLRPPMSYIKAQLVKAAMSVNGVVKARVIFAGLKGRVLTGQIEVIDATNAAIGVTF